MKISYLGRADAVADFAYRRRGEFAGAVASHLMAMTFDELREAPFCRSVFVNRQAISARERIDIGSVSLPMTGTNFKPLDPAKLPVGHEFLVDFTYCLNRLGPGGEDYVADESPYQAKWRELDKAQILKMLVSHIVEMDPLFMMAEELAQDGFFD